MPASSSDPANTLSGGYWPALPPTMTLPRNHGTREIARQRLGAGCGPGADDAVLVVRRDVVLEDERGVRRMVAAEQHAAGLQRGVVGDRDVAGAVEQLEQPSGAPGSADVQEDVVADVQPPRLLARVVVVVPEHVDAAADVPDDVVDERHVLDRRPGRAAVLIAHGEQDGEAVLRVRPVAFEDVAVDQHAARVLQLEQVLHRPRGALEGRVAVLPAQRLGHVVPQHLDVRRHQLRSRPGRRRRT